MAKARVSQALLEVLIGDGTDSKIRVCMDTVEVLHSWTVPTAPAGSFGCAVWQNLVEAVVVHDTPNVKVSQYVVEALIVDADATAAAGPTSFGYAV